jgi:hypothetical protein
MIKKQQKQIFFIELRSGKDMAQTLRRVMKRREWKGPRQASAHLSMHQVRTNSFVTVYDYDIKLFMLSILGLGCLLVKGVL